jgi:hypothetical protein
MEKRLTVILDGVSKANNNKLETERVKIVLSDLLKEHRNNKGYYVATINEVLDKVNEISFLNLRQEQQLHDVATRLSVLRDEVLKN